MVASKSSSVKKDNELVSLKKEVVLINAKLSIYSAMFSDKKRRRLLLEISPLFFSMLQRIIVDDLIISISRITDPAKQGKNKNCTIERLMNDRGLVRKLSKEIELKLEEIRAIRNKRLGHRDLETVTSDAYLCLGVTGKEIKLGLEQITPLSELSKIINEINELIDCVAEKNNLYHQIETNHGPDLGVKKLIDHLKTSSFYRYLEDTDKVNPEKFYSDWNLFKYKDA